VATLISVGDWSLHRSYFSVRVVHINSLAHESRNYVMAVSGLNDHPAMIDVSDAVIVRRIERLRWVASASVTKKWPDSMTIHVVERVPVAVVYAAHHALERVDASDHYLDTVAVSRDLPLLEVVGRPIDAPWRFAPWSRAAAQVAGALPRELQNQVAAVRVTKHGVVSLRLTTPLTFVLGTPTQLTAKFESVASVIKASAVHSVALHAGDVIDVSVPGTLTVSGPS
jgi:cell division protein FtsQ